MGLSFAIASAPRQRILRGYGGRIGHNIHTYNISAWTAQKTLLFCCYFQLFPCRNVFVYEAVTQQRLLYICLSRGSCPATDPIARHILALLI
jgi:hypothetical protein